MRILNDVWSHSDENARYSTRVSIVRNWRKANCLPFPEHVKLAQEGGDSSMTKTDRAKLDSMLGEEIDGICSAMTQLRTSVQSHMRVQSADVAQLPPMVRDSYAFEEQAFSNSEIRVAAEEWATVEENPAVVRLTLEEQLDEQIEEGGSMSVGAGSGTDSEEGGPGESPGPGPGSEQATSSATVGHAEAQRMFSALSQYVSAHAPCQLAAFERVQHNIESSRQRKERQDRIAHLQQKTASANKGGARSLMSYFTQPK